MDERQCEHCGAVMVRRTFPSGRIEGPAMYAKRRFCSLPCSAASQRGVERPEAQRETPGRECAVCGVTMRRIRFASGLLESVAHFAKRRTCSKACAGRLVRESRSPQHVGLRTLLARTCGDCGDLKPGSAFPPNKGGYRDSTCYACRGARHRVTRSDEQHAHERVQARARLKVKQAATVAAEPRHHGDDWTGPELELLATRPDLPVTELALMLGRTYFATAQQRHALGIDPRKAFLAGAPNQADR